MDQQYVSLADVLVNKSIKVQPGELVYIDVMDNTPIEMTLALMEAVKRAGGSAYPVLRNERLIRRTSIDGSEALLQFIAQQDITMIEHCQAGILFRGFDNHSFNSDVPKELSQLYATHYSGPVIHTRSPRRWVVSQWPTPAMAQLMDMSMEQLEELFFRAVLFDYDRMARAAEPLKQLMERTDQVRILGPGDTDIIFSIKGIPAVKCVAERNIPDGEVFIGPALGSANGIIHYNTRSVSREGYSFKNVRFEVTTGRIVKATCEGGQDDQEKLDSILNTDEGARSFGEFAFGFHPLIKKAVGNTLFDEKISGSIHLTPGKPLADADNGNVSNIHWDIVLIQTPEYGGGEIWFDGVLIRKDGLFVLPELEGLNPDNLLAK